MHTQFTENVYSYLNWLVLKCKYIYIFPLISLLDAQLILELLGEALKGELRLFKSNGVFKIFKFRTFSFSLSIQKLKKNVKRKNLFFNKSENMNKNNIYILLLFQYLFCMDFGLAASRT